MDNKDKKTNTLSKELIILADKYAKLEDDLLNKYRTGACSYEVSYNELNKNCLQFYKECSSVLELYAPINVIDVILRRIFLFQISEKQSYFDLAKIIYSEYGYAAQIISAISEIIKKNKQ